MTFTKLPLHLLKPVLTALALSAGGLGAQAAEIDYGAGKVNSMAPTPRAKTGGDETFDYLALKNHVGPSGVPLGGIGVGCFSYAPDGRFTRICINNWHAADHSPRIESAPGTFLAVWRGGQARLLQRVADYAGMSAAKETVYRGLFPTVECRVDDQTVVRASSGLVPHDIKDSSLPLAWIEVRLANPGAVPQSPGREGQILHFDGHYYFGLSASDGRTPVPDNWMVDNTGGWLVQLAAHWQQTGDREWIGAFGPQVRRCLAFLRARVESKDFQIISGPTTYDDFWHPPLFAYNATTYPTFLQAGAVLLDALGEPNK